MTQTITNRYQQVNVPLLVSRFDLQTPDKPLPCRGCTVNCPDYQQCKGKPWRLAEGRYGGSRQ